jgi:carbon monoxide dehydrogenase subunit G
MRLEHNFEVAVPVERAWEVLGDLELIAPCMPGAALTSFDGNAFTGTVRVKIGPVNLSIKGKGHFTERDEAAHKMAFTASGQDAKGAGAASATVAAQLSPTETGTRVDVVTDLNITGRMAQVGRNMIGDVSGKLLNQFVSCLSNKLAEPATETPAVAEAAPATTTEAAPAPAASTDDTADATTAATAPTDPATPSAPATPGASATAPAASTKPVPAAEPEPVDLLALASGGVARRIGPWAIGAVIVVALAVLALAAVL